MKSFLLHFCFLYFTIYVRKEFGKTMKKIVKLFCWCFLFGFIIFLLVGTFVTALFILIGLFVIHYVVKKVNQNKVHSDNSISVNDPNQEEIITKDTVLLQGKYKQCILESNANLALLNHAVVSLDDEDYPASLFQYICSKNIPLMVKFVLMDTRKLTFLNCDRSPYLIYPIVRNKEEEMVMQKIATEIDRRYDLLLSKGVKGIEDYNLKVECAQDVLPYLLVFVHDFSDFVVNKSLLKNIQAMLLKGKKVGVLFVLFSNVEKKFLKLGMASSFVQYFSQEESESYFIHIFAQQNFDQEIVSYFQNLVSKEVLGVQEVEEYDDPMYNEIVEFAIQTGKISASLIQRRFRFGYNRAARVIDLLEARGIIGPQNGSKPREVLVKHD